MQFVNTGNRQTEQLTPGRVLQAAFKTAGLKTTEVADELGINWRHLSAILHDRKDIGLDTSLQLSAKLGIDEELIPLLTLRRKIARLKEKGLGGEAKPR